MSYFRTFADCVDTSTKCERVAPDVYCALHGLVRRKCKLSCNLCCKLKKLKNLVYFDKHHIYLPEKLDDS